MATARATSRSGRRRRTLERQRAGAVNVIYGSGRWPHLDRQPALDAEQRAHPRRGRVRGLVRRRACGGRPQRRRLADLVGVPGERRDLRPAAPSTRSTAPPAGLTSTGNQLWTRTAPASWTRPRPRTRSALRSRPGTSTATGTPTWRSGPRGDVGTVAGAGALNVLYGSAGLSSTGNQLWSQDTPTSSIRPRRATSSERCSGSALEVGDRRPRDTGLLHSDEKRNSVSPSQPVRGSPRLARRLCLAPRPGRGTLGAVTGL